MTASAAAVFGDGFARRALVEAVLVGALCGLVGVLVVLRRLAFFTQSMTHATFPGVVLAALLGGNLLLGTGAFGVLLVVAVAWLWSRPDADENSVVGVVLSAGFALGVALLSAQAGFTKDLSAYLIGSILTVDRSDILTTAAVLLAVVLLLAAVGKELLLGTFDRGALLAMGYPARLLDVVALLMIEATIIAAVPSVGTILSVALIVAPAATAVRPTAAGVVAWVVARTPASAMPIAAATPIAGAPRMTMSSIAFATSSWVLKTG